MKENRELPELIISDFFGNYASGPIVICTPETIQADQVKVLYQQNFYPICYVPKRKMSLEDPLMQNIMEQVPEVTGIIITMSHYQTYY